jgi:hypothetical protein
MMELTATVQEFFRLVLHERAEQDKQWGGEAHDDAHCQEDWRLYISYQLRKQQPFCRCMVKVAALALAAFLSNRRKHGTDDR